MTGYVAMGDIVLRKMLEHPGAYDIDADALDYRLITIEFLPQGSNP
jgi:hypothetical protein